MNIHNKPIPVVVFDQDPTGFTEQDCACVTSSKIFESDCACVENSTTQCDYLGIDDPNHLFAGKYQASQRLHFQSLPDDYTVALDLDGRASLAVINISAKQILLNFHTPRKVGLDSFKTQEELNAFLALVQLGLITQVDQEQKPILDFTKQLTAWLHISNVCNLRCTYCYVPKSADLLDLRMGRKVVDAIFRSAEKHGYSKIKLKYAGGEPTLNFPTVIGLHSYAKKIADQKGVGLDGILLTNSVKMTQEMIASLNAHNIRVAVSLDGIGEVHDCQRKFADGRGSFRHVDQSLNLLRDEGVPTSVTVTVSNKNCDSLPRTVEYLMERDLPFTINFYRETGRNSDSPGLKIDNERLIDALEETIQRMLGKDWSYSVLGSLLNRTNLAYGHERPCGVGDSYIVVNERGEISKCHMESNISLATIEDEDPLGIIRQDKLGIQNIGVNQKSDCRSCKWKLFCGGGCPVALQSKNGNHDTRSPHCSVYLKLFPKVLFLEGVRLLKQHGLLDEGSIKTLL